MKAIRAAWLVLAIGIGIHLSPSARAEGKFYFPVGLAYSEGAHEVLDDFADFYETRWRNLGFNSEDYGFVTVPVGLTFSPYYEWDFGLGVGLSLGPSTFTIGALDTFDVDTDEDTVETKTLWIVPLGMDVRYTFLNKGEVSPYVRLGFRYPLTLGSDVDADSSSPGVFAAVGVEFWRNKTVGMGIEVGYDSSRIFDEGIDEPSGFTIGMSAIF